MKMVLTKILFLLNLFLCVSYIFIASLSTNQIDLFLNFAVSVAFGICVFINGKMLYLIYDNGPQL